MLGLRGKIYEGFRLETRPLAVDHYITATANHGAGISGTWDFRNPVCILPKGLDLYTLNTGESYRAVRRSNISVGDLADLVRDVRVGLTVDPHDACVGEEEPRGLIL